MPRLVHARRIDKNDLSVVASDDPVYSVSRCLRLFGNGRYLFADKSVEKRRFAGIRSPDQRDITAMEFWNAHCLEVSKVKSKRRKVEPLDLLFSSQVALLSRIFQKLLFPGDGL